MADPIIQCVVVLYKQLPEQARSLCSLLEVCRQDPSIAGKLRILVQDNSPQAHTPVISSSSPEIVYHHDASNPGLASAYNRALAIANDRNTPWLLLLDQDTEITPAFLVQLLAALESDLATQACAFVPRLLRAGHVVSPHLVHKHSYLPPPPGFTGFSGKPLLPINSGACLSVPALKSIAGFPPEYWLDFIDYIVFHRLQANGGRVFVLDVSLEHHLSLHNLEAEVSIERYQNILAAEWMFVRQTRRPREQFLHRFTLLKRALKHALRVRKKAYAMQTLRAALRLKTR